MAFPTSPTNGQITVVNQVSYQYSSATNSWTRILSTANVITANTIAVNGALTVGTTISATGNITGSYFFGNGSQLTGVAAASAGFPISAGNSNIAATSNANIFVSVGGVSNVAVFATTGEYITGVLSASGTVTGGNLATGGTVSSAGNITGANIATGGLISAAGNVTGNYILGNGALLTGVITSVANINNGNSNVNISAPGANVTVSVNGTANVAVFGPGGEYVTGVVSASGNVTGGNLLTAGLASIAGNVTGGNITTGGLVTATGNVTGGNITTGGLVTATGNVVGGNLVTGGQLSATGNVTGNYILGNGALLTGVITSVANINNGSSNVTVVSSGGNITVGVGGVSNVVTWATTGEYVTGVVSASGNITGGNVLTGGLVSATGNVSGSYILGNGSQLTGILGSNVNMGTNTSGAFVSNAVTLTSTTTVTNGIALLNQVLGKLVPASPPNFPNATALTLTGIASYRMANIVQVDNTPGANKAVAAGTTVANVLRVATYATNTIANVGPGDAGTIVAVRNGSNVGSVTLNTGASPSGNGTYGSNLVISNNFDYNSANASIAAGFWYVFSARVSGSAAPGGWNEIYIGDTATSNTATTAWYYDNSSPSTPAFSSTTMTPPGSANLLYSSTIPHYTNNNNFTIAFTVANVSGNTYPTANTLASGTAGGAFAAPVTINYNSSNIGSNVLPSFASASANTTASITTGFGGSTTGPQLTVNNSYSSGVLTLTTALANTVLYKSGTATAIDEGNVVITTTIGTGSGNAYRIINPGTGNTPTYTGSEAAFNSQTSTLQTYDATVVGSGTAGVLKHDQTNYSTGYLPAGPNLSSGRTGTQYFTMKFVRTAVSKFDIKYTGNIAGMWVALPGSVIDSSSSANGWINMAVAYAGAGYPGVNTPGNGSDGCALGGTVTLNSSVTNSSKTCTFGTVSSSSTGTNEIYVRIALTSGQSVTALTLETASN